MSNENKKIDSVENVTVSSTVLAKLFGLTTRRIRQLESEGIIKKIARGKYSLQENIKNYIIYIKTTVDLKENKKEENKVDFELEHALLEKIKREKAELELAAMKGEMHFGKDVERVMNDTLSNIKAKMQTIPSRLAPELIAIDNIGSIEGILEEGVADALREASEYNPKDFYDGKYDEDEE